MKSQKITFKNHDGNELAARIDLPVDDAPIAYALLAHCFTCSKNFKAVAQISRALVQEGIGVLRFDFTGLGDSEGDFADTNFSSNVADLVSAAEFLAQDYAAPTILIGHSLGGAAVIQAAYDIPSAKAVVTINAPSEPTHVLAAITESREEIEQSGQACVTLAGRSFTIKRQFLEDLEETAMQAAIRDLGRALLVIHSPVDKEVSIDNATDIFLAARHPKSFVSLDRADHLLSDPRDSHYVGEVIAAWASKYIEPLETYLDIPADDNYVVTRTGDSGFLTEIRASGHSLLADEPEAVGGTNQGPNPYDYLLAGLGACTSMTLRMYADRKKWPLESATVRLSHQKVHAKDCEACESTEGKIDLIEREVEITGPLDDEQRAKLMEIADKCPVHRTLHNQIEVHTRIKV